MVVNSKIMVIDQMSFREGTNLTIFEMLKGRKIWHFKFPTVPVRALFYMKAMAVFTILYYGWIYFWQADQWMNAIGSDIFTVFGAGISTFLLYQVYKKGKGVERGFWFFVFLGTLSNLIAESIWSYYNLILKCEVPFPGVADVFYLIQPTLILLGILYILCIKENIFFSIRLLLDIIITMTVVTSLSIHFLIQPIFAQGNETFLFKLIAVAYPLVDLGLIFGVLSLNATTRTFTRKVHFPLIMGLSLYAIADSAYLFLSANERYYSGSLIDPLWTIGLFLIVIAGLHSDIQSSKTPEDSTLKRDPLLIGSFVSIAIPYVSLFMLFIIMSFKITGIDSIVIGSFLGIILISIRQIIYILDYKHLMLLLAQSNNELEISKKTLEERHENLRQTSDTMKIEARTDFLTGLFNRRYIEESLSKLLEQAKLNDRNFSIFMLDIDYFKKVNDRFGHAAGDKVLQQLTAIILKNTRCEEIIGRYGGEEFIGLLPEVNLEEAEMISDRIRKQIAENIFVIGRQNINVTVSIGVSQWSNNKTEDLQSLIKRIDKALYGAKDKGRNCTVVL